MKPSGQCHPYRPARKSNSTRRARATLTQRRIRIFLAWSQGESQRAIAARERIHPGQVGRDIDAVIGELRDRNLPDAERNRRRLLGEIAWQKQELRAAWERSKKLRARKVARRTEIGARGKGVWRDAETVTEGRDGDPRFLAEIAKLEVLEGKLLGLITNLPAF